MSSAVIPPPIVQQLFANLMHILLEDADPSNDALRVVDMPSDLQPASIRGSLVPFLLAIETVHSYSVLFPDLIRQYRDSHPDAFDRWIDQCMWRFFELQYKDYMKDEKTSLAFREYLKEMDYIGNAPIDYDTEASEKYYYSNDAYEQFGIAGLCCIWILRALQPVEVVCDPQSEHV
eukprot:gene9685-10710_t